MATIIILAIICAASVAFLVGFFVALCKKGKRALVCGVLNVQPKHDAGEADSFDDRRAALCGIAGSTHSSRTLSLFIVPSESPDQRSRTSTGTHVQ
jgi:hypothetical protein